jgi:hypothetical protein
MMVIIILISLLFGAAVLLIIRSLTISMLNKEVRYLIITYQTKLNGLNRFLLNEELLATLFKNYPNYAIRSVWRELVILKLITRDPMDNEWCIRIDGE